MRLYLCVYILMVAVVVKVSCDCGILAPSANPSDTIEDGTDADIFPWHVVIYALYSRTLERRCSGTLISADVVITTADCVGKFDVSVFFVTTNNYTHQNWTEDSEVQKSRVETIHLLNGNEQLRVNESGEIIAWLVLQKPFNITPSLGPVCIDLEKRQEAEVLPSGLVGLITYWPITGVTTRAEVRRGEILSRNNFQCAFALKEERKRNILYNPSCLSYSNYNDTFFNFGGTAFYSQLNGRWYLRGIVSGIYTVVSGNDRDHMLLMMNIKRYADKINRNEIMKTCGIEGSAANPLIAHGNTAEINEFPWHVAIYRQNSTGYHNQVCAGSLISSNIVISAAHCFYDDNTSQKYRASSFAVAAGKHYRLYEQPEKFVQKSAVKTIHLSAKYYGAAGLYAEDIAWIILQDQFNISTFVRPICLISDNWHETEELRVDQIGKVAGWGENENDTSSLELQKLNMPYVPHEECLSTVPEDYKPYLSIDKFCAGYLNGSSLCGGDSGGGLAFKYSGRWYLRGVVSNTPGEDYACGARSYTAFTHVGRFNDELIRLSNVSTSDLF